MCELDKELLQEYIDGELEPLAKVVLEEHLRSCQDCRREINKLKILDWDLQNFYADEVAIPAEVAALRKNVVAAACQEERQKRFTVKEVYDLQVNTVNNSLKFIGFIPGLKTNKKVRTKPQTKQKKKSILRKIIGL